MPRHQRPSRRPIRAPDVLGRFQRITKRENEIEERLGAHGPCGRVPEGGERWAPSLQQQRREHHAPGELRVRARVPFLHEHADGDQQGEEIDGIEARQTREPEIASAELALLGALGIVVGEHESGEQQEETDRGVAVVDNGRKGAEPFRIREVEEDDVESGEGPQAGEGGKLFLFGLEDVAGLAWAAMLDSEMAAV